MVIYLTQKAIKALDIKEKLIDINDDRVKNASAEDIWYCNTLELFRDIIDLFFVHEQTLFNFPMFIDESPALEHYIRNTWLSVMMLYSVPPKQIDKFMVTSQNMYFVKGGGNKSLLSVMNEMKLTYQLSVDDCYEKNKSPDIPWEEITLNVNSNLHKAKYIGSDYVTPEELFVERYGGKTKGRFSRRISNTGGPPDLRLLK